MQRYFIQQQGQLNCIYEVTSEDSHHIKNVMRLKIGDKITGVFENEVFICEIIELSKYVNIKTLEQIDHQVELPLNITIVTGVTKGDKYEYLLQKATELGCHHFILMNMDRSVAKLTEAKLTKKLERWQKIVKEAAEQSQRKCLPDIQYLPNIPSLIEQLEQYDVCLLAYEESAKQNEVAMLKKVLATVKTGQRILCIFGPEGGISENEFQQLTQAEVISVGLGPRILRAETAPLYFLSAISFSKELL